VPLLRDAVPAVLVRFEGQAQRPWSVVGASPRPHPTPARPQARSMHQGRNTGRRRCRAGLSSGPAAAPLLRPLPPTRCERRPERACRGC
jgi:hypothetical protein